MNLFKVNPMIMSVKYCKSENEFHIPLLGEPVPTFVGRIKGWVIPLLGGDKGVGLLKKIFTFLIYNILPVVQIKDFKQVHIKTKNYINEKNQIFTLFCNPRGWCP